MALSAEWIAGFFEGEGHVGIGIRKRDHGLRPYAVISITQKDPEIVNQLVSYFGFGKTYVVNSSQCRRWIVSRMEDIEAFIVEVLPFIQHTRKRKQLELALQFVAIRSSKGVPFSQEQLNTRLSLRSRFRKL